MIKLNVEIAQSSAELAKGLMFRDSLPEDEGMLFDFPSVMPLQFWGKNTYIPLDIAFVDQNDRIVDIRHIAPMSTRLVSSSKPCVRAIEANAGFFAKHGIQSGSSVTILRSDQRAEIKFS